jgi:hypothetical protein
MLLFPSLSTSFHKKRCKSSFYCVPRSIRFHIYFPSRSTRSPLPLILFSVLSAKLDAVTRVVDPDPKLFAT